MDIRKVQDKLAQMQADMNANYGAVQALQWVLQEMEGDNGAEASEDNLAREEADAEADEEEGYEDHGEEDHEVT